MLDGALDFDYIDSGQDLYEWNDTKFTHVPDTTYTGLVIPFDLVASWTACVVCCL